MNHPGRDAEDVVRELQQQLHPFAPSRDTARDELAADARADERAVMCEHTWLSTHDLTVLDDDPVGVLGPVLQRLAASNAAFEGYVPRVECAGGWHRLVAETDRRLADLDPDYALGQVKEKFGFLRIYASPSSSASLSDAQRQQFRDVVQAAESASRFLCEVCGRADACRRGTLPHRVRTLCATHAQWGLGA